MGHHINALSRDFWSEPNRVKFVTFREFAIVAQGILCLDGLGWKAERYLYGSLLSCDKFLKTRLSCLS